MASYNPVESREDTSAQGFSESGYSMFYTIMRVKGKYYLYRVDYVGSGRKRFTCIGPCDLIERLVEEYKNNASNKKQWARSLAWLGRRPHTARKRGKPSTQSYNPELSSILKDLVITDRLLDQFMAWCISIGNSPETCRDRANYLKKPLNPSNDHSVKAYRLLLKMLNKPIPDLLKTKRSGVDLKIPSDQEILDSLEKAKQHPALYLVYKLLIESGARLREAIHVLNNYNPEDDKPADGFYKYTLSRTRGTKKAFFIYHVTPITKQKISEDYVTKLSRELNIVRPKYIRKWVATKLLSLGVPSEVVDYIQGRTPTSILSRHYLKLSLLADEGYKRYAEFLEGKERKKGV